ncbi:MAG: hypothetical protein AB7J35_02920 [Dehalococcoidia bacterium]
MTAALLAGAAVSSSASAATTCLDVDPDALVEAVEASNVIVAGVVHEEDGGGTVRIEPDVFLLGAASNEPIRPRYPDPLPECALARLSEGQRVLAFLDSTDGVLNWPSAGRVFWLSNGEAVSGGGSPTTISEVALVQKVRGITGQYAVPASNKDDGAGIDWGNTVLPLGVVLLIIFGIGLVLMRVWHRIDPS